MKTRCGLLSLILVLMCSQAAGGTLPQYSPQDCKPFAGKEAALPAADLKFLKNVVTIFKKKDRKGLLALMDKDTSLVRRFAFSVTARGGQLNVAVTPNMIGKKFAITVPPLDLPAYTGKLRMVHYDTQLIRDFGFFKPRLTGQAYYMNRKVCDGYKDCYNFLPQFNQIEDLFTDLLGCTRYHDTVFVFSNGILMVDMEYEDYGGMPNGTALLFTGKPGHYKLANFITFE